MIGSCKLCSRVCPHQTGAFADVFNACSQSNQDQLTKCSYWTELAEPTKPPAAPPAVGSLDKALSAIIAGVIENVDGSCFDSIGCSSQLNSLIL